MDIYCPYRFEESCIIEATTTRDATTITGTIWVGNVYQCHAKDQNMDCRPLDGTTIIVPENYVFGYLNIARSCSPFDYNAQDGHPDDTICDLSGDADEWWCNDNCLPQYGYGLPNTVQCSPDHKGTESVSLDSVNQQQTCSNTGASYCCPYGERTRYQSNNHEAVESDFDYDLVDLDRYITQTLNHTEFIDVNVIASYVYQTKSCDATNCIFRCSETLSCALSTIYLNGTDQTAILISCSFPFSCLSTNILTKAPSSDLAVTVICSGTDSSNELTINLTQFGSFNMYCVETGACQEVTVNLNIDPFAGENRTNNGVVHCVLPSVCNDLTFNTKSELSQLLMYEFSRGTVLNNGIGYLSAIENIECNTNRWIQFDGLLETDLTVIQSVHNEYDDDSFPCEGVEVQCDNDTVAKSCVMTYNYIGSDIVETLNDASDMAFAVNIEDLYRITCNGDCEESPTQSPTAAPTRAPSIAPSTSPSLAPSNSPSVSPSFSPSRAPTSAPSTAPTASPSQAPTRSPSVSPSLAPSCSPSVFPTTAPTAPPTNSPSRAPSDTPSTSPSSAPSDAPSAAPSTFPSQSPSLAPSTAPTMSPSEAPTSAPSQYPTFSPSRTPSSAPSVSPSLSPSTSPSASPSTAPSIAPSDSPTDSPSNHPSNSPSVSPTSAPSLTPSIAPSFSPSDSPTTAPTAPPTNIPTAEDAYDNYIEMEYNITQMSNYEMKNVAETLSVFPQTLVGFIEAGLDDDEYLEYQYFEVNMTAVNGVDIGELLEYVPLERNAVILQHDHTLSVTSYINCSASHCLYIINEYNLGFKEHAFEYFVTQKLRHYFAEELHEVDYESVVEFNISNHSTQAMSFQVADEFEEADIFLFIIVGCILAACLLILTAILCMIEIKKRRRWREALQIRNGLIVSIAIGEYDSYPVRPQVGGTLINLPVGSDVVNLRSLAEFLNFSFLTVPDKFSWTKDEILEFVKHDIPRAFFDENGDARFDGLIFSISSHGMGNNVISSDYKKVSRTMIHRLISDRYPEIREIPRIFMFDACDGAKERKKPEEKQNSEGVTKGSSSLSRQQSRKEAEWTAETKNPDYNSVVVHGANDGFVSLMKTNHVGSYLTYFFVKAVKQRIKRQERKGLEELLTDIQNALHDSGKQLIRKEFFNNTATLRIEKNNQRKATVDLLDDDADMIEMVESPTSPKSTDLPMIAGDCDGAVMSDSERDGI